MIVEDFRLCAVLSSACDWLIFSLVAHTASMVSRVEHTRAHGLLSAHLLRDSPWAEACADCAVCPSQRDISYTEALRLVEAWAALSLHS